MSDIPVVILAGGQGMRIREETEFRPKPMISIGERPIIWHIMKIYASQKFSRFIICLGYKGEIIKQYFLNYKMMHSDFTISMKNTPKIDIHNSTAEKGWNVTLAETGLTSMTGARLKKIEKYVKGTTFMVTYGDGVADVNIRALLKFHKSHGKIATITGISPPSRFGELLVEKQRVMQFSEKPHLSQRLVNGGFFVFNKEFFQYLSEIDSCTLEKEPLEKLARDKELMVYPHSGFWQCMDTIRDMNHLTELWLKGEAPWKIWEN